MSKNSALLFAVMSTLANSGFNALPLTAKDKATSPVKPSERDKLAILKAEEKRERKRKKLLSR